MSSIFIRSNPVRKYRDYKRYRKLLRNDFRHTCSHCIIKENQGDAGGHKNFEIDHFKPKTLFPSLISDYSNLHYSCSVCNGIKSDCWPSNEEENLGRYFVDNSKDNLYKKHTKINCNGELIPKTPAGEYTVDHIRLNRRVLKDLRKKILESEKEYDEVKNKLLKLKSSKLPCADSILANEKLLKKIEEFLNPRFLTDEDYE